VKPTAVRDAALIMYTSGLALSWLASTASAAFLRNFNDSHKECRMHMRNNEDVDFTIQLGLGGQKISVIPDTGSFAMVIFSDMCTSCGPRESLLHPDKINHFAAGTERAIQNYGSGMTFSTDAYAPAEVHCTNEGATYIRTPKQMFWMTVKANLPVASQSSFQGIFGLGPPHSDPLMAELEAAEAKAQIEEMKSEGTNVDRYEPVLENLEEVARFTKTVKPWLKNNGMTTFSVCLRARPGQDGVLIYNDQRAVEKPHQFAKISVDTEGPYWQTTFSNLKLGASEDELRIRTKGATTAILDTGTSLIGAPGWFVESVAAFVEEHLPTFGCNDVSLWPDLKFTMGGEDLALPASSYIGKISGMGDNFEKSNPQLMGRMPHLKRGAECTAMIFSTTSEEDEAEGSGNNDEYLRTNSSSGVEQDPGGSNPDWIFGLPFFRKYYTTFMLSKDSAKARQVFLAEADHDCEVMGPPGSMVSEVRMPRRQEVLGPMAIDPRKLHFPERDVQSGQKARFEAVGVFGEM